MQTIVNIPDKLWKVAEQLASEHDMTADDYIEIFVVSMLENYDTSVGAEHEWETKIREDIDRVAATLEDIRNSKNFHDHVERDLKDVPRMDPEDC